MPRGLGLPRRAAAGPAACPSPAAGGAAGRLAAVGLRAPLAGWEAAVGRTPPGRGWAAAPGALEGREDGRGPPAGRTRGTAFDEELFSFESAVGFELFNVDGRKRGLFILFGGFRAYAGMPLEGFF